jgi:3-hydroxyacyl-CoA dehydrogenase
VKLLEPIAILGAGPEACEAARLRAHSGHLVRIYAPEAEALSEAVARIRDLAGRLVTHGEASAEDRQRTLDGILATTDLAEALEGAAIVIDHR